MFYEIYDIDSFDNLAVKNWFLYLKALTLEHTHAKQISCEIYTP